MAQVMKILQIDAYHYVLGGAEKVMFNTAQLLEEKGHQVVFFSLQWEKNLSSPYSGFFANSKESRRGVFRPLQNVVSYFYHSEAARKLDLLLQQEKPDIAQVHLMWGNITPSILPVLKKHEIPVILTVHDYRMICPAYVFKNGKGEICEQCKGHAFWRCFINKCAKGSYIISGMMATEMYFRNNILHAINDIDGFIFVSQFCRKKHEEYIKAFREKMQLVLYNFSNEIERNATLPSGQDYFLYYGRLSHEKGIATLIQSIANNNETYLKIVGTGTEEMAAKKLVSKLGANNIEFCGYKQGDELRQMVKNAKFVVVPSEWYENNPMTIVEAYSLSTPVIGARIGGIPEIIDEGMTGYSFESGNPDSLRQAINKASDLNDDDYMKMRNNALLFAQQHFNRERYYQRLMDFYQDIIKSS